MRSGWNWIWAGCLLVGETGCVSPARTRAQNETAEHVELTNPFFVPAANQEEVWERTVDVLHDYFEIARENRLDGVIETQPKVGSGVLEPWQRESVGLASKLESSLQSIRRRGFIRITPVEGGYLVGVEVFKEREDVLGVAENSAGGATFQEAQPLQRDLNLVVGQTAPSGWIPLGRDAILEQRLLTALQQRLE